LVHDRNQLVKFFIRLVDFVLLLFDAEFLGVDLEVLVLQETGGVVA
jgi:hypothetical protein